VIVKDCRPTVCASEGFDTPFVHIVVGSGEFARTFDVHTGIIAFYSGYFKAMFKEGFVDAETRTFRLSNEDPYVFERVRNWIYSRNLCGSGLDEAKTLNTLTLVKLWIFGDKYAMPLLQNPAVDLILRNIDVRYNGPTSLLPMIYEGTGQGSALRRLFIDIIAKTGHPSLLNQMTEKYWCRESLLDFVKVLWQPSGVSQTYSDLSTWDTCLYHVHEEGVRCSGVRDRGTH